MVRRAVFTTAYSSCECVIIFIFLRGRFPRFGLFIIFFVVMVLSFFFLSWRSRRRLQTPHASLIEESVDVQTWRQMHLHSRIHVVSVVIVQSVKKKKWSCDDGSGLTKSGAARREWMLWWLSQAINSILLKRLLCSFCPWQVLYYICNITHSFERRSRNVLLWLSFVYILTANRDTLQWPLTFAKGEVLVTCYPSLKIYTKIKKYYKKWKTKKGKKSSARYWIPVTSPKLSSPSKKPDSNCDISESSVRLEEESADVLSQMAFSHLSQILESIRLFARSQIKFLHLRISLNCGSTFLQHTLTHHRCLCFLHT